MLLFCILFFCVLQCSSKTFRTGEMSSQEMEEIRAMISEMSDVTEQSSLEILTPPESHMERRVESTRCRLGSKEYCPGEILFRIGEKKVKAKLCGVNGKFYTKDVGHTYRELERCQHRSLEYCTGEMLRGFSAWNIVQRCNDGRLQLVPVSHDQMTSAMDKFRGKV